MNPFDKKLPKFENSFQRLPSILFEEVIPTPLRLPRLISISKTCARDIGWDQFDLSSETLKDWLNGNLRLEGDQRISTRYAGHQFGVWAGQLGDGRAISLGEYLDSKNQRWEIQTKGSGLTPFSRRGDGKAVLRSTIREYLCSEAMNALNIPSSRALALIAGKDAVLRETVESSALLARVFPSNLRFGHFEYCFHFGEHEALQKLINYTQTNFYPECDSIENMLEAITLKTADLIARWMSVGFCHGVMNTDNMSILGMTIDYGPFGFLEDTHLQHICNHSDHHGVYAYDQQPQVALWNLDRLMVCFSKIIPIEKLREILELYSPRYEESWLNLFRSKLGLRNAEASDRELTNELLQVMNVERLDFTFLFRRLSELQEASPPASPASLFQSTSSEFLNWIQKYKARLARETTSAAERKTSMNLTNPKYVLRNYLAQEVIDKTELGENEFLEKILKLLESPFEEHPEFSKYAEPTPQEKKDFVVSCSS